MFCRECGNEIIDNTNYCPSCGVQPLNSHKYCQNCGANTTEKQELCVKCGNMLITKTNNSEEDIPNMPANIAACCFPIVGLILYFVWKKEKPKAANSICLWAVVGFLLGFIVFFFSSLFGMFL